MKTNNHAKTLYPRDDVEKLYSKIKENKKYASVLSTASTPQSRNLKRTDELT